MGTHAMHWQSLSRVTASAMWQSSRFVTRSADWCRPIPETPHVPRGTEASRSLRWQTYSLSPNTVSIKR
jgi:hypothetical protein